MQRKIGAFPEMPIDTGIEPAFTGTKIVVPEKLTREETEMFKKLKEISKFNPRRV